MLPLFVGLRLRYLREHGPKEDVYKRQGETLLQAESLWFRYDRNGPDVVKDFSLSVGRGELLALLGGNGTGKTTVLHLLAGLRAPQRGRLRRQGRVAMLPQNLQTLFWKKTLREDLLDQTARMDLPPAEGAAAVAEIAALCGLCLLYTSRCV